MTNVEQIKQRIAKLESFLPVAEAADRGEEIEVRNPKYSTKWSEVDGTPIWDIVCEYRIKPKPPVERWAAEYQDGMIVGSYPTRTDAGFHNPGAKRYFLMREVQP